MVCMNKIKKNNQFVLYKYSIPKDNIEICLKK